MTDQFINQIFKTSVAAVSQKLGWDASQTSAIDILADIWKRQLLQIGKTCHRYAEHYGRTEVNHSDVILAFRDLNLSIPELEEYVQNFDPVRLPFTTPKFPVPKQSHLNFLRPGSKEVLSRPVHIHEYMPPWEIPEETTEKSNTDKDERKQSIPNTPTQPVPSTSATSDLPKPVKVEPDQNGEQPKESDTTDQQALVPVDVGFRSFASSTKRGSVGENPALKRVRMLMQEEGHPLREISSVMMTTSGYLSSSREGRLPDSRPPPNRDFFDPEPVVEKKKKSVTMKKIVEGVKKIEKENQDDEVELFGKPDRLIIPEMRQKSDTSKKPKESSKIRDEPPPVKKHIEKEARSDKLKIFKKKSRDAEKHAKHHGRDKNKPETAVIPEPTTEVKMEQDLEEISSEEGTFQDEIQTKPVVAELASHEKKKKKSDEVRQSRKEKKEKRERERLVPGVVPIPRVSPKIEFPPVEPPLERAIIKQKHRNIPPFPQFSFGDTSISLKTIKSKKMRRYTDIKSLIPEISLNVSKPLPPLPDLKPFLSPMSMGPGLVPANLGPPPPLRFGGSSLSPSITITPAAPSSSSKESRRSAPSLPIPSTVCASVTITRIDMPSTSSQEPPSHFEPPPANTQHTSGRHSPLPVHHVDSSSGITITPILMTGDGVKQERFEKPAGSGGGGGGLALLDEDLSKEQRRKKEKEKRKEIKKEKKKEKKEKLREKERQHKKDEKVSIQLHQKKERKESSRDVEPTVPKLTLKLHTNASTPVDSPANRVTERTETPPPAPARKITIKPIEDLVSTRTPSPEVARFSPLITRPPKLPKVPVPKPSPPVMVPTERSSERRASGKSKSKSSKGSSSQSQQSGLVTETVGFYIDEHGQKVWICPAVGCGREDDGSPMIGCDSCDDWYHFACVGIEETPDANEHWYCPRCVKKGSRKGR